MALAERNNKYNLQYGNFGVGGNFFQKVKHISADHAYSTGDGLLLVDTTDGNVIITLPTIAAWPVVDYRIILPIMHIAGLNGVKLQLSGDETFLLGNTYFWLGAAVHAFDFYVINSESISTYGLISDLDLTAAASMTSNWPNTSWAALAIVPLYLELYNWQEEIFKYQGYLTGAIASVADVGDGTVLIEDGAHGLTAGQVVTIASTTNYDGTYTIVNVPDDDHYTITETFVATATGTWVRPARYTVLTDGMYKLSFSAQIDSTGGVAWDATGGIYVDDALAINTNVTVSGAAGENKTMILPLVETYLPAGSVVELKMDNGTLTGNMTSAVLNMEMKAL